MDARKVREDMQSCGYKQKDCMYIKVKCSKLWTERLIGDKKTDDDH